GPRLQHAPGADYQWEVMATSRLPSCHSRPLPKSMNVDEVESSGLCREKGFQPVAPSEAAGPGNREGVDRGVLHLRAFFPWRSHGRDLRRGANGVQRLAKP